MTRARRDFGGFTLIELLVALAIFALLAVIGTRSLLAILDTRQHLSAEAERWRAVDALFSSIENDCLNAFAAPANTRSDVKPPVRLAGDQLAFIIGSAQAPTPPAEAWRNPAGAVAGGTVAGGPSTAASAAPSLGFRAVTYRLKTLDNASGSAPRTLLRQSRVSLSGGEAGDTAVREEAFSVPLRQWQVRYADAQGAWQPTLPQPTSDPGAAAAGASTTPVVLPTAIEVTLWLADDTALARPLRRVFLLPGVP